MVLFSLNILYFIPSICSTRFSNIRRSNLRYSRFRLPPPSLCLLPASSHRTTQKKKKKKKKKKKHLDQTRAYAQEQTKGVVGLRASKETGPGAYLYYNTPIKSSINCLGDVTTPNLKVAHKCSAV
jgi:hypothetical protein